VFDELWLRTLFLGWSTSLFRLLFACHTNNSK
jgi:hypothetical protein